MRGGRALKSYCALIYGFLYLPLAVMAAFSFNDARRNVAWRGFTLKWYAALASDEAMREALGTSLALAASSAAIATALGLLAAYSLARQRPFPGRRAAEALLAAPLMMPEVALGVGLLSLAARLRLELGFAELACAHALIGLPYALASIKARLRSLGEAGLEDAAMDLGASRAQAFLRVTLPLALPAVLSGALLAFTVSFEDFVVSFFVSGIGLVTMPVKVYSMMKFGVTPEINALSVLLLGSTAALLALNSWASRRLGNGPAA